jgi:hypothetical protein
MISPKIVSTVSGTILSSSWTFDSVFKANLRNRADEDWISTFARTGGNAIISGDRAMLKRPELLKQISSTGLIALYLPAKWSSSTRDYQLAYFIYWWKKMEATIIDSAPGAAWIIPSGMKNGIPRQYVDKRKAKRAAQEARRKP